MRGRVLVGVVLVGCGGGSAAPPDAHAVNDAAHDAANDAANDAAVDAPAALQITSSSTDFGSVGVGAASAPITFTVTNAGGSPSGLLTAMMSGPHPGDFVVQPGTDTCGGTSLAVGGACTLVIRFTPLTAGARSAALVVGGTAVVAATLTLAGTAITSDDLNFPSPSFLEFGPITVGVSSAPQTITISNVGFTTHGPITLTLMGSDAGEFAIVTATDTCSGASLAPSATCMLEVTFTPTTIGAKNASVVGATPTGQIQVGLHGSGVAASNRTVAPAWTTSAKSRSERRR